MTENRLLRRSIEHLHGPEEIPYGEEELVVVCLVRDGRPYVKSFVEHYLSLGAKHLVFLDNGSADGTIEALEEYDHVTVLRTKLPYKEYIYSMKQYLIARFGKKDRWCLYADIDELFDYPYSDAVGLGSLLGYLASKSYTAVAAQMLDMFPEEPLTGRAVGPDEPLKGLHRFYDLSDLGRRSMKGLPRFGNNVLDSDEVEWFNGGIRDALFGVRPHLTKFPLMFSDGRVKPFEGSSHWVDNARIADLTCVLLHYKFLEHFREQAARAVREENYWDDSAQYKKYLEVLESDPSLQVKRETSKEIEGVNELLEDGFLVVSEDYVSWVNAEEERNSLRSPRGEPGGLAAEALLESRRRERAKALKMQRLGRRLLDQESQIHSLQQRLERIEASRVKEPQRVQQQRLQRAQRQIRSLEQRLERVETSRTWKLMKALHRTKASILALGRSSSRIRDRRRRRESKLG